MSAKYTEFVEYKIFYSEISQYKVLSTNLHWKICEKTKKCLTFHKLIRDSISSFNINIILKNMVLGHYQTSNQTPNQVPISVPNP